MGRHALQIQWHSYCVKTERLTMGVSTSTLGPLPQWTWDWILADLAWLFWETCPVGSYPECPGWVSQTKLGKETQKILVLSCHCLAKIFLNSCFTTVTIHLGAIPSEPRVVGPCLCFDGYWHSQWRNVLGAWQVEGRVASSPAGAVQPPGHPSF